VERAIRLRPVSVSEFLLGLRRDLGCSINGLGVVDGAGDRIRTGDVHLGKVAFCH
jgi:hypothetical protein